MSQTDDIIISPSVLSADFSILGEEVSQVVDAGANWVHLDVMDGQFVPNLSFGAPVIAKLRRHTTAYFDAHLMVQEPQHLLADFAAAGVQNITVHAEACTHLDRTLTAIRELGCHAGVALNPHTPLSAISHILDRIDMLLIMTVNPGFGGQSFIPAMIDKIANASDMIADRPIHIQVDGGITAQTAAGVKAAGASNLVAGSAIFGEKAGYAEAIRALRAA